MSKLTTSLLARTSIAVIALAVGVAPVVAQLDPCFEDCHAYAMGFYEVFGQEIAELEFEICMYEDCGGM